MELLPMELVVEILKRVPAKSICRIRCVCKMLLSIVDSPSFVSLHSKLVLDPNSHLPPATPQFLVRYCHPPLRFSRQSYNKEKLCSFHSLHYDPQGPQLNPQLLLSIPTFYTLEFVFNNLCGIKSCADPDAHSFLINPLRREVLRLPRCVAHKVCGPKTEFHSIGMGFDSVTSTYKILRIKIIFKPEKICSVSQVKVLVLGTSEWRQVPSALPSGAILECHNVCAYGDIHWLLPNYTREGIEGHVHILSFDFKKEEFFWIPNPCIFKCLIGQIHLINFRGSIAIVVQDTTQCPNIKIWVMKDYSTKQWMLDYSININMLELDPHQFQFWRVVCCEREHGILFIDKVAKKTLILDLRRPVVTTNLLEHPIEDFRMAAWSRCMSLYGSLMSLKSYANLGEAEEPATYANWSQGEASGKNFFTLTR